MFDDFWATAVDWAWGPWLVVLMIGSGLYFTIYSRGLPFRKWRHALDVIRGKFDRPDDPGEISHFAALSTALSATLGMGNISGVAIAIGLGGPGAIFWMWVAGLVGMATKYFTCTLAVLYRKKDQRGVPQGGPMYYLEVGLGRWARPLAVLFSVCGMIGCLALFQVNQLSRVVEHDHGVSTWVTGTACMVVVGAVILGGIVRVGEVTRRVVPAMFVIYFLSALYIIVTHLAALPDIFAAIFTEAFSGRAAAGGVTGLAFREVLVTGVQRAAFSNEAGVGTAPMAHGAARTHEPVREGLIAMLGPFLDTNIICTLTALVILSTGVPYVEDQGVIMTMNAFQTAMGAVGRHLLTLIIVLFSVTTMISYSYYSLKCAKHLLGERIGGHYIYVYLASLPAAAILAQDTVTNIIDTCFALMAIPTLVGALLLSGRVMRATRDYFQRIERMERMERIEQIADPGPDHEPAPDPGRDTGPGPLGGPTGGPTGG